MHTLRHTAAMMLLTAGVDTSTIALWLGHEQERTTHIYLHADLELMRGMREAIAAGGFTAWRARFHAERETTDPLQSGSKP